MAETMTGQSEIEMLKLQNLTKQKAGVQEEKDREASQPSAVPKRDEETMARAGTGQSEEIERLKLQMEVLTKQFGKLLLEKESAEARVKEMEKGKVLEARPKKGQKFLEKPSTTSQASSGEEEADGDGDVSTTNARQRLRRFCKRRSNGSLAVPEDVHQQWLAGGTERKKLLKLFVEADFNRDRFL